MDASRTDVIVIGAGASGLTAAICAARLNASVLVIEKTDAAGQKLSMTGNGRCNLSNMALDHTMYNATAQMFLPHYLNRFGLSETLSLMESIGIVVQDEDGYLYPISYQATSVVNALRAECERLQVSFAYGAQVKSVESCGDSMYAVTTAGGDTYTGRSVILCSGALSGTKKCGATGDAYYLLKQWGVTVTKRFPALVPLLTDDETMPQQTGVRAHATLTFMTDKYDLAEEYGEVQFYKEVLSGIPVLQASAAVARALSEQQTVSVRVDLFPAYSEEEFDALVASVCARRALPGNETVPLLEFLEGFHNRYLNEMILRKMKMSGTMKMKNIPAGMLESILRSYRKVVIPVTGVSGYDKAQATSGGVPFTEVDEGMQLNRMQGVYVAGELMDVDGRCGGYNLQWAWTSGAIAGSAAAERALA